MKQAIAIGIQDTAGGFAPLPGAVAGARRFAAWASTQHYEVTEFIDADIGPVTRSAILTSIAQIVASGTCESLIIYFAGHGLAADAVGNKWLLSAGDVGPDPNDAIDVTISRASARMSGIDHVAFIGDACRSGGTSASNLQLLAGSIFPASSHLSTTPVDLFLATQLGKTAVEIPADPALNVEAYGIFSSVLFSALEGDDRRATENNATTAMDEITGRSLSSHLESVVPRKALTDAQVRQDPFCDAPSDWVYGSFAAQDTHALLLDVRVPPAGAAPSIDIERYVRDTDDFVHHCEGQTRPAQNALPSGLNYRVTAALPGYTQRPDSAATTWLHRGEKEFTIDLVPIRTGFAPDDIVVPPSAIRRQVLDSHGDLCDVAPTNGVYQVLATDLLTGASAWATEQLVAGASPTLPTLHADSAAELRLDAQSDHVGRDHFETGQGISVIGADIVTTHGPGGELFVDDSFQGVHVRRFGEGSALLAYDQGVIATASFNNLIGTVVFSHTQATVGSADATVSVERQRVDQLTYWPTYSEMPHDVRRRMALVQAAAAQGRFGLAIDAFADVVIGDLPSDPALAVLAAYGHFMQGDIAAITSIVSHFRDQALSIPYDLLILDGLNAAMIGAHWPVAVPSYPLLTATWALLPDDADPALLAARSGLLDSLWTVMTTESAAQLIEQVNQGVLQ